ncbi:MAG: hypothetical protein V4508_10125 [Pseudomonadota bacterium]
MIVSSAAQYKDAALSGQICQAIFARFKLETQNLSFGDAIFSRVWSYNKS